jgi:hypothetical protein
MTDSKRNETRRTKQKVKVKVDKAKGIEGPKNKIRTEPERQQDKIRKLPALKDSIIKFSFHLHLATTFFIFILFFHSILSDHLYHHFMYPFQTFTSKDLKDC